MSECSREMEMENQIHHFLINIVSYMFPDFHLNHLQIARGATISRRAGKGKKKLTKKRPQLESYTGPGKGSHEGNAQYWSILEADWVATSRRGRVPAHTAGGIVRQYRDARGLDKVKCLGIR